MSIDYADPDVWNDENKTLWRQKLAEFIQSSLPFIPRKDMKVICLPGAGAREVLDIYTPLGIPPKNIICLERDGKVVKQLQDMQLGVKIEPGNAIDFFEAANSRYHVISLDYKGLCKEDEQRTIEIIANKGLLGDCGVLSTVFLGARESKQLQQGMFDYAKEYLGMRMTARVEKLFRPKHRRNLSSALEHIKHMERLERQRPKSRAEASILTGRFTQAAEQLETLLRQIMDDRAEVAAEVVKVLEGNYHPVELDEARDSVPYMILSIFQTNKLINAPLDEKALPFEGSMLNDIAAWQASLEDVVTWRRGEGYSAKGIKRYVYQSNKGSRMMADMYYFTRDRKLMNDIDSLMIIGESSVRMRDIGYGKFLSAAVSLPWRVDDADESVDLPPPEHLGTSKSKAPSSKATLSVETVLLLAETMNGKEIANIDPYYTPGRVAALKAHVTMGTYMKIDGQYIKTSELERLTAPEEKNS